jgi:hypothetical protein
MKHRMGTLAVELTIEQLAIASDIGHTAALQLSCLQSFDYMKARQQMDTHKVFMSGVTSVYNLVLHYLHVPDVRVRRGDLPEKTRGPFHFFLSCFRHDYTPMEAKVCRPGSSGMVRGEGE